MSLSGPLTYAELFAGAGGLSLGLELAGWSPVAHAEIEPHARAVLRHHWPDCRLDGDVAAIDGADFCGVTLLSGGFPCQDVSVAGKRAGLAGARTGLFYEATRIIGEARPLFILLENVMGLVSSNNGEDIEAVLAELGRLGYLVECEELDAQNFGVPQRRRRVFFVCVDVQEAIGISGQRLMTSFCESTRVNTLVAGLLGASAALQRASRTAAKSSDSDGSLSDRGLERMINTFSTMPAPWGWRNWPSVWTVTSPSSPSGASGSASPRGSSGTSTLADTDPTGDRLAASAARLSSIARLWSELWDDLSVPASASTISTWSRTTTDSKISMCAEMSVLISEHTAAWTDLSPHYWSAVSSCLTVLPASIAYLRTQTDDLFVAEDRREHAWILLARAERVQLDLIERARTGGVDPAEVLALSEGLRGDSPPLREAREGTAADAGGGAGRAGIFNWQVAGKHGAVNLKDRADSLHVGQTPAVLAVNVSDSADRLDAVMGTLGARSGGQEVGAQTRGVVMAFRTDQEPEVTPGGICHTLDTGSKSDGGQTPAVLQVVFTVDKHSGASDSVAPTLKTDLAHQMGPVVANTVTAREHKGWNPARDVGNGAVQSGIPRRLMPVECERLMGWPDGHTAVGVDEQGREYELSDTARYRLCGNGVASPVAGWIAWRLRWALEAQG